MTILVGSYTEFEERLLCSVYYVSNIKDRDEVSFAEVVETFSIEMNRRWLERALGQFVSVGWAEGPLLLGDVENVPIGLTAAGLREAERLIETNKVTLERVISVGESVIPASDRIVSLSHNLAGYGNVADSIKDVAEAVRGYNGEVGQFAKRDRVLQSLEAAALLWGAGELRIIQIKVGVLMAAEDAARILADTGKAVVSALLVDTIKAFVKNHFGIDLDTI